MSREFSLTFTLGSKQKMQYHKGHPNICMTVPDDHRIVIPLQSTSKSNVQSFQYTVSKITIIRAGYNMSSGNKWTFNPTEGSPITVNTV